MGLIHHPNSANISNLPTHHWATAYMSWGGNTASVFIVITTRVLINYSLRFGKGRRLGQRNSLQSATLTSYFYKNNY
jgi:hypothetical protein